MNKKRILIIAPFPPPFNGNSLPVKEINDYFLSSDNITIPINLNKQNLSSGIDSLGRIFQILSIFKKVWSNRRNNDLIYFTISESFAGNLKDLIIYSTLFKYRERLIIHMLGGAGMKKILDKKRNVFSIINKFFISRIAGVIVEGNTQKKFFSKVINEEKIHVIPNFAENYLFIDEDSIVHKFADINHQRPLKIVFLSNLIFGKGHEELIQAYLALPEDLKSHITIDFAGGFDFKEKEELFIKQINKEKNLTFHGTLKGEKKAKLLWESHIFCLPTYYPYEGQPFSILEAYASGCVLVTTNHSGIFDVFTPNENGFEVDKGSVSSLCSMLQTLLSTNMSSLLGIALNNLQDAKINYNKSNYLLKIEKVFNLIIH